MGGCHCMTDEPEIVKQLRYEERTNTLVSSQKEPSTESFSNSSSLSFHSTGSCLEKISIPYKQLLDNANVLIQSITPEGEFLYVNKKWKEVLGYSDEDVSSLSVWDIIREDHQKDCQRVFSKLFEGEDFVSVETVFMKKSGESVFVKGNVNVAKSQDGKFSTIGFFRDISLEKQVNEDYEFLFNESCEALFIHDIQTGEILDVNKKMTELYGYTRMEALSLSIDDLSSGFHHYTQKTAEVYAKKTLKDGPQTFKWQAKHKNGQIFWVEITLKIIELRGKKLLLASARDISQRVRIEKKLKENVKKFRLITTSAADAIIMMDPDGMITYWNPAAEKIFGYKKQEVLGTDLHQTIAPVRFHNQVHKGFELFKKTGDGAAVDETVELMGIHKDGHEFPVELSLSSVELDEEWHAIAIIRDISKRKENETKLQTFSEAVKQNPASVVITDPSGKIEYVNPQFEYFNGYSLNEVKGKNPRVLKSGEQPLEFYKNLWSTIAQGNTWHGEFHNKKKNGELYWEEARISPIKDKHDDILHYVAIKEDITDKKQMISDLHVKENAIMSSINGMMLIDLDGNIVFVNKKFLRLWDIEDEDEIIGKPAVGFWRKPGNYLDIIDKTVQGEGWFGEVEAISVSKDSFYVQLSANLVLDEQGEPAYIMNSFVDITDRKKAEDALRESEEKFRQISENMGEVFWLRNADNSKMLYVSPAYEKIWGRSCESLYEYPESFMDSVYDEDKSMVFKEFEKYQRTGIFNLEYRIMQPTGEIRWVHARSFPIKDDEGAIIRHTGLAVDITEQKKLEEEFRKFKTISDKAGYGSLIHDKEGIITYVNTAFAKHHGYDPEEIMNRHINMFFDPSEKNTMISIHKDAEKHEGFKGKEVYHKHKDGSDIPLLMSSTFIETKEEKQSFYAETFVDIRDLKKAQRLVQQHVEEVEMMNTELTVAREQLATLNQDLEKKVDERTAEVQKLLKQKDEFINQLGHDLRTPLTPMLGLLPLLKKRITDEKGLKYISMIDRNIRFMKELVNKTITFAKLNSDKIEFSFTDLKLSEFMSHIQQQMHATLEKEQAQLLINIDPSLIVYADEMQLSEVFHNLISNSLKYKREENAPVIEITANETDHNEVTIQIRDNGIGMTKKQIEYAFDEFYKADDARTDIDSHGLGLNICKRIIEKHGGRIWAESEGPGKGSHFIFTLHITDGEWNPYYNIRKNDEDTMAYNLS